MSNDILSARSRVGVACQRRDVDAEREARRDLAAAKLAAYIEKTVASAPELSVAQRKKLTLLLGGRTNAA